MPCRLFQSPLTQKEETSILWNQLYEQNQDEAITDEQYKQVASDKFTSIYGDWTNNKSKIPLNKVGEPVFRYVQDYLNLFKPKQFSDKENELFNAFDNRIKQYGIQKIEDKPTDDESESSSYYIRKDENGKEVKIRRVTEVAKAKNKARNGGVDYFANATQEQKEQWAKKAMAGTNGHKLLEDVTKAALNEDGTVKAKSDIDLSNITTGLNGKIAKLLTDYLLGSDTQIGLLYTFPAGTRFKTEQILYSNKDNLAGTTDLLAFKPDGTVEVLDYKFMGFDTDKNIDIPIQKRQQHAIQLGEYKKIITTYGIKPSQITARTIPIHAQYSSTQVIENGKRKWLPVLQGVTVGNVNMKDEDRTYLLSVVPDDQSTGNIRTDDLIKSLKSWYKKIYNRKADDHGRELKNEELNTLSAAIRNIQTALNFDPLAEQAMQFQRNTDKILDEYKTLPQDINETDKDIVDTMLDQMISALRISDQYSEVDEVFLSAYGEDELTEKQQTTYEKLKKVASDARKKQDKLLTALRDVVSRIAEKEGVHNLTIAEKELTGIQKDFRELGAQQPKAMQTLYSIYSRARSMAKIKTDEQVGEFGKIYNKFAEWGKNKGKELFDLIATKDGHELISETSKDLWKELRTASEKKDKQWLKKNIDIEKYDQYYEEALNKFTEDVMRTSDNDEENKRRIDNWKMKYDINSDKFFGYDNWIVKKTIRRELWYTPEYKELLKPENKPALDMYNYIADLNRRAYGSGYLSGKKGLRFLPFIKGTTLQRLFGTEEGFLSAVRGSIADRFSVQVDDEIRHAQIDEETGEVKRTVPKFFTTDIAPENKEGKKDYGQLSHDLNRIIPLYIQALNEYESSQDIEATAEALEIIEENKGHLEVDKLGNIITHGNSDQPRVFKGNEKNSDVLKQYIDDAVYGIKYDREAWADKLFQNMGEGKRLSTMKVIQQTNKLTQLKALGLKLIVAIPNYFGANMQAMINSGNLNTSKEFFKNELKVVASQFQGHEGNITKGLIDYFVPINEDITKRAIKKNSQSPLGSLKYWNMSEVLMSGLSIPDKVIQYAQALSILDNTMVQDGKLVNIRKYLRNQSEWQDRYKNGNVRQVEKEFNKKVKELQETKSLKKIAKFNKDGFLEIPGIDRQSETVAEYRNIILQTSKQITGQMSEESKRLYTRDIIKRSFMMFKNWVPQLLENRFSELKYNKSLDTWEYGRIRLLVKTMQKVGYFRIGRLRAIQTASPKGLQILHEMWEQKREDHLRKNGIDLSEEMTEEQFYDLVRSALSQEAREVATLLSMMGLLLSSYAAVPPDDDGVHKNLFKMMARTASKTSDEILFYYNPLSFETMTRGTILPSIGVLSDAMRVMKHTGKLVTGEITGDENTINNAHPIKSLLNAFPISNYFANELYPLIDPEGAKELGIQVTSQARPGQ